MTFRLLVVTAVLAGCAPVSDGERTRVQLDRHIYVWAGAMDSVVNDALIVLDVDTTSATYGQVVGQVDVGAHGTVPHHIQRRVGMDGRLFANSWVAGTTWVFDVGDPNAPAVHGSFATAGDSIGWAHDFASMLNGNTLVAFNAGAGEYVGAGGLAEVDRDGAVVQWARARSAEAGDTAMTPYTVHMVPGRDRAVVGNGEMGMGDDYAYHYTSVLQLWSTAPLAPMALIPLPNNGTDQGHVAPSTVATTASGAMFANTFYCGLFHVSGLDGDAPRATRIFSFPGGSNDDELCAVATTVGNYWIQAVAALPGVMVLDLSDPAAPREVARLMLNSERFPGPHWVSADLDGTRLAITGMGPWLAMARFDPETGALTLDDRFKGVEANSAGMMVRNREGKMMHPHGVAWGP
jgi:hypothetical protein